ncbi:MAG: DUF3109 family protein [Flavobacteriaceae bacterium]
MEGYLIMVKNKECAYVVFNLNGTTSCGIENAYKAEKINWKKPISCHLYPSQNYP